MTVGSVDRRVGLRCLEVNRGLQYSANGLSRRAKKRRCDWSMYGYRQERKSGTASKFHAVHPLPLVNADPGIWYFRVSILRVIDETGIPE